ncbi:hypothetical protein [Spiroplasma platyhelix]|uniref:Uncharacterized protein n=1 Tax=Spiroplasma platyhelix PALS-1 TaxID=1276218 RepID=A0A846U0S7_9MOLU|nr:hypothetical protein [Spiroplasma platyhelix]MBE4704251.1 hypothetical protein [Spiroplasma platyhelix PALS-1]NKE38624.1 hypothetical protein [Spiroplasma platyhelix PALS-1]UJB28835.1 hypothetical protein SPLAT_v1c00680 [Spiroplasma platyhelix PALS-1]
MKKLFLLIESLMLSSVVISPIMAEINENLQQNEINTKSLDMVDLRLPSSGAAIEVELPNLKKLVNDNVNPNETVYETGITLTNKNNESHDWLNDLSDTSRLKTVLREDDLSINKVIARVWENKGEGFSYLIVNLTFTSSENKEPKVMPIGRFLWFTNQVRNFWTEAMKFEYEVYSK